MPDVVGVRFKKAGKIYYFDPEDEDIKKEDFVIVETSRGVEFGEVVVGRKEVKEEELVLPLKRVIRTATVKDHQQVRENREKEDESFEICLDKISEHGLDMKLIDVEYTFDRNKIIFYFTADGRIDFRELVKDLAAVFRTRIELRQIGVRDEAKMMGGLGPCGRMLCCSIFLGDFEPVSIRMAKDQNLSLNPTKISGICSRLMCCLRFESDAYKDAREVCPRMGKEVVTPEGEGRVVKVNTLKKSIAVELFESHKVMEFPLEEVIEKIVNQKCPKKNEGFSD
ncbi:PSP1 domain-containing protein [Candidatus Contubernalis alkaliaceticus]|uniref:PSP1 domain-containing protein n=1 Tax=Candidatus Contubernalis alkaliaceticus TaxID=338645 RepID=UPI001F4BE3B2|nr:stage 0 sporulation family protein [Candidatus Contubernalis alkalaceticus]UNC90676.1 stage 0 sporulation family protein [Candidatus Contubernalis alkalaceticus]